MKDRAETGKTEKFEERFTHSAKLKKAIRQNLEGVGYGA